MSKKQLITNWDNVPVMVDLAYASRILGVNKEYLRKLSAAGKFPAFRPTGTKIWRVYKEDLQKFGESKEKADIL